MKFVSDGDWSIFCAIQLPSVASRNLLFTTMFDLLHEAHSSAHKRKQPEDHWEHVRSELRKLVAADRDSAENSRVFNAVETFEHHFVDASLQQKRRRTDFWAGRFGAAPAAPAAAHSPIARGHGRGWLRPWTSAIPRRHGPPAPSFATVLQPPPKRPVRELGLHCPLQSRGPTGWAEPCCRAERDRLGRLKVRPERAPGPASARAGGQQWGRAPFRPWPVAAVTAARCAVQLVRARRRPGIVPRARARPRPAAGPGFMFGLGVEPSFPFRFAINNSVIILFYNNIDLLIQH